MKKITYWVRELYLSDRTVKYEPFEAQITFTRQGPLIHHHIVQFDPILGIRYDIVVCNLSTERFNTVSLYHTFENAVVTVVGELMRDRSRKHLPLFELFPIEDVIPNVNGLNDVVIPQFIQ
jgi:hypothetical protein